jgi:hypothetical protein
MRPSSLPRFATFAAALAIAAAPGACRRAQGRSREAQVEPRRHLPQRGGVDEVEDDLQARIKRLEQNKGKLGSLVADVLHRAPGDLRREP